MELAKRALTRPYEVVILMHPDSTDDQQKELFRKNKSIIESFGGQINHLETWGRRNLGNPIQKVRKAYYFHSTFMAGPGAVAELERTMRINDRVLRFQHTRLDERVSLSQFLEQYRKALAETANREREREAKVQQRKAAARAGREGGGRDGGGPRGDRDGGGFREGRGEGRGDRGEGRGGPDSGSRQ